MDRHEQSLRGVQDQKRVLGTAVLEDERAVLGLVRIHRLQALHPPRRARRGLADLQPSVRPRRAVDDRLKGKKRRHLDLGLDLRERVLGKLQHDVLLHELDGRINPASLAIHNVLLEERPDLIDILHRPFNLDWRGENPEGEKPWYTCPMFSYFDGKLTSRLTSRAFFESVVRHGDHLALTDQQREALDVVQEIGERESLRLSMDFQEGDIQFINNHQILLLLYQQTINFSF